MSKLLRPLSLSQQQKVTEKKNSYVHFTKHQLFSVVHPRQEQQGSSTVDVKL